MSVLKLVPGTSKVIDFQAVLDERREQDRIDQAQQAAGWFFNRATAHQKAKFDTAMGAARGCVGPVWDRRRAAARKEWAESTKEAAALFDRTVEHFIGHDEISEELDAQWTAMLDSVAVQMAAE